MAADCFGGAVHFELRAHGRFPFMASLSATQLGTVGDDTWKRVIDRRPTLGDCINAILQAEKGVYPIAQKSSGCLWEQQPDLIALFKAHGPQFREINRLRRSAQHANVTEAQAATVLVRASQVLSAIRPVARNAM